MTVVDFPNHQPLTPLEVARSYLQRGWKPLPIQRGARGPTYNGWGVLPVTSDNVADYFNSTTLNIGVQMGPQSGGLCDVDIDCLEGLRLAPHFLPPTGAIFGRLSNPASHRLYNGLNPDEVGAIQLQGPGGEMLVELRLGGDDSAVCSTFPGSIHPEGEAVEWVSNGEPATVDCAALKQGIKGIAIGSLLLRHYPTQGGRNTLARCIGGFLARAGETPETVARFVKIIATEAGDDEVANREQAAESAAEAYADGDNAYGLPKLIELIGEPAAKAIANILEYGADGVPAFSEEALALEFAQRHAGDLRYVAKWGQWYCWDGTRWQEDRTRKIFDLSRHVCREAAARAERGARAIANAKTRAAVVSLASDDRRHAATVEQWDADPWLLNTPGGIVDLKTGQVRTARPEDYMTMMTAVAPLVSPTGGIDDCPRWHSFLDTVTGNNGGLKKFLQVSCGYALTGLTREQILLFLYGLGQNGKSVFIRTIADIFGDYHAAAPMEMLIDSRQERHPTDLAGLRGARLVTAAETEEGRCWSETKVKQLTGDDEITARFMRQDFFTYVPQFLLMVYGNHKPGLKTVDEAIRRRLRLTPFAVHIPEADRDRELTEKLKLEWSGILSWMIEGCLIWQREGLVTPPAVEDATQSYLATEDAVGRWLEECCERDPQAREAHAKLFTSWSIWAARYGEFVGSGKRFSQLLLDRGFASTRIDHRAAFIGLKVAVDQQDPRPEPPPREHVPSF